MVYSRTKYYGLPPGSPFSVVVQGRPDTGQEKSQSQSFFPLLLPVIYPAII
jgi:hypothetical protein